MLLADEVLFQASWSRNLQDLLDVASWWEIWKDGEWSVAKCSYLKMRKGRNEAVYHTGERLRDAKVERYLVMTMGADGIPGNMSKERVESTRAEVTAVTKCG